MKKSITVLFILLLAVCGATGAFAQSESDFEVTVANGAVTITKYTGSGGSVVIPATIGGQPVASIDNAFFRNTSITSVSIPAGVTSIRNSAFYNCTSLTGISVDPRNPVYTSRDWVLFNKAGDELIAYPAGKKETQYAIPAGVTSIGYNAFSWNTSITSVSIPASVTSIGDYAFNYCTGLTGITVDPRSSAYSSRDGVLFNKAGDTLVTYPAGKKEKQYAVPAGVTSIGDQAFYGCTGLTSISIPASITDIEIVGPYSDAFYGCSGLMDISVDPRNTAYMNRDGVLFTKAGDRLIKYPAGKKEEQYAIPASVTTIGSYAFEGCSGLASISIPTSVTWIGFMPFENCTGSIRIGANVVIYSERYAGFDIDPFSRCYNTNGKKAGVYTYQGGAWSYAER